MSPSLRQALENYVRNIASILRETQVLPTQTGAPVRDTRELLTFAIRPPAPYLNDSHIKRLEPIRVGHGPVSRQTVQHVERQHAGKHHQQDLMAHTRGSRRVDHHTTATPSLFHVSSVR